MKNRIYLFIIGLILISTINALAINYYSQWMVEFDQITEQHERDMDRCSSSWFWLRSDCYREADAWWTGAFNGAGDRYYACDY